MTDIELLARRVEALEEAQLDARVSSLAATQDQHTIDLTALRGDVTELRSHAVRLDQRLDAFESKVSAEIGGLRRDLPSIVADAMREVLKPGAA